MMRTAILLFVTIFLVAPPALSQPPDDRLIVPGVQIGKWKLGMSVDELARIHGKENGTLRFLKGSAGDADFLREAVEYRWEADDIGVFTFGRPSLKTLKWDGTTCCPTARPRASVYKAHKRTS